MTTQSQMAYGSSNDVNGNVLIFQNPELKVKTPERLVFTRNDVARIKREIEQYAKIQQTLRENLKETTVLIDNLRHELYEAQMQNTPITLCPPTGKPKKDSQPSVVKVRITKLLAKEILTALLEKQIIHEEDLII